MGLGPINAIYQARFNRYLHSREIKDTSRSHVWAFLADDEMRRFPRGGHDYRKIYAAFKAARDHVGQPTVILAHTIKGWTLGGAFEGRNATHQMKKLTKAELKEFRDRLHLPISDGA